MMGINIEIKSPNHCPSAVLLCTYLDTVLTYQWDHRLWNKAYPGSNSVSPAHSCVTVGKLLNHAMFLFAQGWCYLPCGIGEWSWQGQGRAIDRVVIQPHQVTAKGEGLWPLSRSYAPHLREVRAGLCPMSCDSVGSEILSTGMILLG